MFSDLSLSNLECIRHIIKTDKLLSIYFQRVCVVLPIAYDLANKIPLSKTAIKFKLKIGIDNPDCVLILI